MTPVYQMAKICGGLPKGQARSELALRSLVSSMRMRERVSNPDVTSTKGVRAGIEFVGISQRKCQQIDEIIGEMTLLERQAEKLRQEALKRYDEKNRAREERREARKKLQEQARARWLRLYGGQM